MPVDLADFSTAPVKIPNPAMRTHFAFGGLGDSDIRAHPIAGIGQHDILIRHRSANGLNFALNFLADHQAAFAP